MALHDIRTVHVQTSFVCSGKCIYCPYPCCMHSRYHGAMSDAVFETVLARLGPLHVDTVYPCLENEPFTDPAIFERADALFKAGGARQLNFTTNALLLDAEKQKKLADLLAGKRHEINIIFHGTRQEHYTRVMGIPFAETLGNVLKLLRLAQEADLCVAINCAGQGVAGSLFQDYSCPEKDFILFWEDLFRKNDIRKRPKMRYRLCLDRAGSSLHRAGIHMPRPVRDTTATLQCRRVLEHLHILYTGELVLCSMDYARETVFGDITHNDLACIFEGKAWRLLKNSACGACAAPPSFLCRRCLCPEE